MLIRLNCWVVLLGLFVVKRSRVECTGLHHTGQHEEEYRRQLGRYGVIGDLAIRPVRSLSGGQKSRVVMALMSMIRYACP